MAEHQLTHFQRFADKRTACGKISVLYRTDIPELVTCPVCNNKITGKEKPGGD